MLVFIQSYQRYFLIMAEGLFVFTTHRVEQKVMACLGFSPMEAHGREENGYTIQKYHVKGVVYYKTVIRASNVVGRAKKLQQKLGNNLRVFIISPRGLVQPLLVPPAGIQVISSIADFSALFQIPLTPAECNELQEVFSEHQPTTQRNMVNSETTGEAEIEFSNQFFSAVRAGRHIPAPDSDMFRGAVFFTPNTESITIVQTSSDEDETQLRRALEISMYYPQPIQEESPEKRRRVTPASWLSVLKNPEPSSPGYPNCIYCESHRATICFVPCGHQVMCDSCVRQMCELPDVRKICPCCRGHPDEICRPIISEIEK